MVPAPPENREEAKSIVSSPALALAKVMASLKEVTLSPELSVSKVVVTMIGVFEGVILSSR